MSTEVFRSCLVEAKLEDVWKVIGKFDDLGFVSPDIQITMEEVDNTKRRCFPFGEVNLKEELLETINNSNHCMVKYNFVKGFEGFKVDNYVANFSAFRNTYDNSTFVIWKCTFDLRTGFEDEKNKIEALFETTISNLPKLKF
eukprot:gene8726-674_t